MFRKIKSIHICMFIFLLLFSFSTINAAQGTPNTLSYQGRLTDNGGNALGGGGTNYYFKFSIWDSPTPGQGTKLWPTSSPNSTELTVKQGSFSVNIGDTDNGYPDVLDYNFNTNSKVYLQVEVSGDNVSFETLAPRSSIAATAFSQVANSVNGTADSSFGTTTPFLNTLISALSTNVNKAVMTIKGAASQVANLFNILDSNNNSLFTVTAGGNVGVGATSPLAKLHIYGAMGSGTDGADTTGIRLTNTIGLTWRISSGIGGVSHSAFNISQPGGKSIFSINGQPGLVGNVGINVPLALAKLDIADTTLAGSGALSGSILNLSQTWNTTGAPTALKLNVTDTASAASSLLMDLQVNGVSVSRINKLGDLALAGSSGVILTGGGGFRAASYIDVNSNGIVVPNNGILGFSSVGNGASYDTAIFRDGISGTLAQRNGINAQTFRLYNTYTDANNYERAGLNWSGNALSIGTENAGTGIARSLNFITASTTRMIIDANGNIGVGTTTPSNFKLQVAGDIGPDANSIYNLGSTANKFNNAYINNIYMGGNNDSIQNSGSGYFQFKSGYNGFGFLNGATTVLRIDSSGNVGIGITSPTAKLHSYNATLNTPAGYFQQTRDGGGDYGVRITSSAVGGTAGVLRVEGSGTGNIIEAFDGATNVFVVKDGGNVGIATTTPTQKLSVIGNAQFTGVTSGTYGFDLNLTSDGILTTSASDINLKENIMLLNSSSTLDKLSQLKPSSFDWKSNKSHDIGLIAQEVEQIFPELVFTNPTDGYKGINYSRFITLLISAVQELSGKVAGFAKEFRTEKLCVGDTCVTENQLKTLLQNNNINPVVSTPVAPIVENPETVSTTTSTTTEGNNQSTSTPVTEVSTEPIVDTSPIQEPITEAVIIENTEPLI